MELLEDKFRTHKDIKIKQALSDLKVQHESEKENLIMKYNIAVQEFISSYGGQDFESRKMDMLHTHDKEISCLEHTFLEECDKLKASITAELESKHAHAKIETREGHYQV